MFDNKQPAGFRRSCQTVNTLIFCHIRQLRFDNYENYTACYPGPSCVRITTREYVVNILWGYLYVLRMDKRRGKERVEDGKGV